MAKKWRMRLAVLAAILLIAGNLYLILKENSKIEKTVVVENWRAVKQGDLRESLQTSGVVSPKEEFSVYFDAENGAFQKFFVNVGDKVSEGTPLFEYTSYNIEQDRKTVEAEQNEIEEKIDSLEEHIEELKNYLQDLEEENDVDDKNNSTEMAVYDLEKEIYNKELEKEMLEKEANKYDDLLNQLEKESGNVTVKSEYDGIVKSIHTDLKNPVVTIISKEPVVKGVLSEDQLSKVSSGMEAKISSRLLKESQKGKVGQVVAFPKAEPDVDKKSEYPFLIDLEEKEAEEPLHPGAHVSVDITTKKVENAEILPVSMIHKTKKNKYVYVLNGAGKIEKRPIKTGLKVGNKSEITEGIEEGELVVTKPDHMNNVNSQPFITPVKAEKLKIKTIKEIPKKEYVKYILLGFLR